MPQLGLSHRHTLSRPAYLFLQMLDSEWTWNVPNNNKHNIQNTKKIIQTVPAIKKKLFEILRIVDEKRDTWNAHRQPPNEIHFY